MACAFHRRRRQPPPQFLLGSVVIPTTRSAAAIVRGGRNFLVSSHARQCITVSPTASQHKCPRAEKTVSFWTRTKMKGSPDVFDNAKSLQIQGSLTKSTTSKRRQMRIVTINTAHVQSVVGCHHCDDGGVVSTFRRASCGHCPCAPLFILSDASDDGKQATEGLMFYRANS